ncbi:hypothetical protein GCM10010256_46200 [Streptomyces coeruleorubidus]|uniref:Uncharacterized protein n=1 Tax=Streptomyces coeruleorubidus TaxID=116188 RepID=A0A5J6HWA0_STRC4|nr:hypothetical protein CP976_02160 [Streptomyces coeruleorubidus]GGT81221.1 hypothetical protein GCM10010256_46200 [Streptomyces coeruleorubidus]
MTGDAQVAAPQSILAAHGRPATDVLADADAGREPTTGTSPQTTEGPYSRRGVGRVETSRRRLRVGGQSGILTHGHTSDQLPSERSP